MLPQPGLRDPLRFNRKSLYALLLLVAVIGVIAFSWPDLAVAEWNAIFSRGNWVADMDWLLLGLGVFFFVCTALDPRLKEDLATVGLGMLGGAIIEVWGTRAGLWYYYTGERPHAFWRERPFRRAGHRLPVPGLKVRGAMACLAAQGREAAVVVAPHYVHKMRMVVVPLRRCIARGMAVQAARMAEYLSGFPKERHRALAIGRIPLACGVGGEWQAAGEKEEKQGALMHGRSLPTFWEFGKRRRRSASRKAS